MIYITLILSLFLFSLHCFSIMNPQLKLQVCTKRNGLIRRKRALSRVEESASYGVCRRDLLVRECTSLNSPD